MAFFQGCSGCIRIVEVLPEDYSEGIISLSIADCPDAEVAGLCESCPAGILF